MNEKVDISNQVNLFRGIVRAVRSSLDLHSMLNLILDALIDNLNAEVGLILIKDKDKFLSRAAIGLTDQILKSISKDGKTLWQIFIDKKESGILSDISHERLSSILYAPLVNRGEIKGFIILGNKVTPPGFFLDSDLKVIHSVLEEVSIIIENSLLYEEIVNLKNYNDNILNSLPNGIITTDTEGIIVTINQGAEYILNIKSSEHVGKRVDTIFQNVLRSDFDIIRCIKSGENLINYDINLELKNGKISVLGISVSMLKSIKGNIMGAAILITDLTEKKFIENQIARAEQLAALGEMSAGVAHEIRNPLTSIQGFTQLLPKKMHEPEFMQKYVEIVTRETNRLNDIVERFLSFARPRETGFQQCQVEDIIKNCLSLLHYQIEKNGIKVNLKTTGCPSVWGDWQQLEQVFINIILNAIQFMNKPEKKIFIATSSILRKLLDNRYKEFVAVRIEDNGSGIPQENIDKIFNPFYTTRPNGTGLGLSITSQIVEKHNGSIEVNSIPGKGTVFIVYLPVIEK